MNNTKRFQSYQNLFEEETDFQLPDGSIVNLINEHILSNEILFTPNIYGLNNTSLPELVA